MQKYKYLFLCLPLVAITMFSCHAQKQTSSKNKKVQVGLASTTPKVAVVDTFVAEKNKPGDEIPEMKIITWDNKIVTKESLIKGEPILFVLFNPSCGHCKDIVKNVKANLGMFKEANIIFLAGKPLQGQLAKFVLELKIDKTEEMVVAGDDSGVIDQLFEYNGIPQVMLYNKDHKLEYIYYKEASMLDIQNKMYGR